MTSNNPSDAPLPELKGKRAIITGIGGFLGKCLSRQLRLSGAEVIGLDLSSSPSTTITGNSVVHGDILDFQQLSRTFSQVTAEDNRDTIVFHLAGQAHVGRCKEDPLKAFALNVTGTANLLEACRRANLRRIVFPSTALVYSLPAPAPLDETADTEARSIYAATKIAAEALVKGYSSSFGFSSDIVRLGNVYGEEGASDSIVAIILRQVLAGGPITIKTLAPIRDFIYREDVIRGMLALAAQPIVSGCRIFNLSSGTPTSIRDLALKACSAGEIDPNISESAPMDSDRNDKCVLSIERLSKYAGWHPVWTLEEGLRRVISEIKLRDR